MIVGDRKPQVANCKGATDATEYARYAANLEPIKEVPQYPEWLLSEARHAWRRVAQHLVDRRILAATDIASLGLCCQSYGRWRIAKRETEICGADAQNTLAKIAKMEWKFFKTLCKDFGLSPADFLQIAEGDDSGMWRAASGSNGI